MNINPISARQRLPLSGVITTVLIAASLTCTQAADQTKQDNADALDLGTSWISGTAPGASDLAIWSGAYNLFESLTNATFTLNTPVSWGGITVAGISGTGAGPIYIGGIGNAIAGSQITIGTSGINLSGANQDVVINAATNTIGGYQTWNLGNRNLRFGTTGLGSANANIDGTGTVTISGTGVADLNQGTGSGSGLSEFAGKFIVGSGATLRGTRSNTDAWGVSTAADAIKLNGGTLAVGGILGAQGNWTWSTPIELGAGTTSILDNQNPSGTGRSLNLNGVISGTGNLEYRNSSSVNDTTFSFNPGISNTYSGTTLINGAARTLRVQPALGTAIGFKAPFGTSVVTVDNATLRMGAGSTANAMTNDIQLHLKNNSTLTSADGVQTYLGNITLSGQNKIQSAWANKNALLNGVISDGTSPGSLVISSENNGDARVFLNANNTYSGGTVISNGYAVVTSAKGLSTGFVELPNNAGQLHFIPATAGATTTISALRTRRDVKLGNNVVVNVTSGNVGFNAAAGFWIQPVGSGNTGTMTSESGLLTLSSVDPTGVVTTGNLTTSDHQLQVVMTDYGTTPLAVVKNGANSLGVNQANTFTGGLTVNGGRWNASNARSLGSGLATVNNGGQISLGAYTFTNNFALNGLGVPETDGVTRGALRFGNGTLVNGTVTAASNTRVHAQDGNATIAGPLAGAMNIEKTGSSQLTISGASPGFAGTLIAGGGPLNFTSSIGGNLAVSDGATILGEGVVAGTLTLGSSTGAVIRVQGNTPGALTASSGLTLNGISTISVDSVPAVPGPFPVINYGGTFNGTLANLTVSGLSAYRTAPTIANTGSSITLALQNGLALTWAGTNGNAWDLNTTVNWNDGTSEQKFMQMDSVTFDDTAVNGTVDITGLVQPSTVTFNNSITEYVLNGAAGNGIVGPGSVTKSGTTNVTLGGANDFTGSITVNGGALKMGSTTAFGRTSGISVGSGAQVDINGQQPGTLATGGYTYTIAGAGPDGSGALVNSGVAVYSSAGVKSVILADNASVGGISRFDIGNANVAGSGTITGNGKTLTKVGANAMGFRGDASGSPINIVVDGGNIWAENTDNAYGGTTGTLTINPGAKAGTYGTRSIATPVTINNGGILYNEGGGAGTWTGTITANDGAVIEAGTEIRIAGNLNSPGSIDKTAANQVTVIGTANIAGDIDIQDGVLQVGDMGTSGTIGNPGSVTITRSSDGNPGLRYRLGGVDATLASPVYFGGEFSELRHHPAYPTNKLTLTGPVGNSEFLGVLDVETGTMALAGSGSAIVNRVALKGTPNATDRGVLQIPTGTSLTARYLNIGAGGNQSGILNVSGGTVTMAGGADLGVRIGHWNNNDATYGSEINVSAGTFDATALSINATDIQRRVVISWDGMGTLNVGGGVTPALFKAYGFAFDGGGGDTMAGTMNVLPNGTIEVGAGGMINASAADKVVFGGGKLIGTESATWVAGMQLASAGEIEANSGVIITNTGAISGTGSLTKNGLGALILAGTSPYSGATIVNAGTVATPTSGSCSNSAVTFANGTTHAVYITSAGTRWTCASLGYAAGTVDTEFNFGAVPPSATVAPVLVNGNLAFSGTVNLKVSGNVTTVGTYPLIKYTGTLSGTPPSIPASLPVGLVAVIVNNTANKSIDLQVTTGNVLAWATGNGAWDIGGSANWKDGNNNIVTYAEGRAVQFDDTASGVSPIAVTLDTVVSPGMVTAANALKDYSISGSGSINGFAGLTKRGGAKLTLSGAHTYSSGTLVSEGTLQLGDGTANNGVVAGPITTDATLVFANPLDQLNAISISGTGAVVKASSGTLTFNVRQTYTGGTIVNAGVLDLTGGGGAIGTIRGVLTVNSGGTVRLSAGDVTGYGLDNRVHTINLNGGTMDVNIQSANGGNQTLGNATINMTGGTISGWLDGNIDWFQGQSTLNTFASPNPSIITGVPISPLRQGTTTFTIEDGAAEIDLDIASVIRTSPSGDAADATLIKAGAGTMRLTAVNTFQRPMRIDAGTVLVDGSLDTGADVTVKTGGTLGGIGSITGNVTVESGGTFTPATNSIGTMSILGALTLSEGSTTTVNLDATTGTSDFVQGMTSAGYGGNLTVNVTGTPALGQTFTLFSAGTPGTGNFSSITPAPAPGNSWSFDPANGQLTVVQGPPTTPTSITSVINGSNLEISWPADHTGWQLQVQTNPLNVGLSNNWTAWPGSTTTNRVFVPITTANPTLFLRLVYPPQP